MNEFLSEFRDRRKYYEEHPEEVDRILKEGTEKAHIKSKEQFHTYLKLNVQSYGNHV